MISCDIVKWYCIYLQTQNIDNILKHLLNFVLSIPITPSPHNEILFIFNLTATFSTLVTIILLLNCSCNTGML